LLALADRLATLSPFEVLGIHATDDAREIKRGYFETSRRLHPDAYHGRELGNFRELLSRLFARAKGAYGELRDAKVRAPYVHARQAVLAEREGERARMQAERAAVREAERAARAQAEHHEREREAERVRQMQAERMRAQAGHARRRISEEVAIHVADAEAAEAAGNLPRAANHLRLALQVDPHDAALNERWQRVRGRARSERAKVAFARANTLSEMGQSAEALPLLVEAAEADPTAEYLAHAADGLRTVDVARARDFAIRALEALQQGLSDPTCTWDPAHVVRWRVLIGRAFLSAGQIQTAREQARLAAAMRPDDREVKALLGALARAPR
jgi:curved DNA-binding protein CbpA